MKLTSVVSAIVFLLEMGSYQEINFEFNETKCSVTPKDLKSFIEFLELGGSVFYIIYFCLLVFEQEALLFIINT